MIRGAYLCAFLAGLQGFPAASGELQAASSPQAEIVDVRKIWDAAPHNAFTDLIRYKDRWWCVFREGKGHVSDDGALRVLTSKDGDAWESASLVTMKGADLRDAKIVVAPDGRLMLNGAGHMHPPSPAEYQTFAWYSEDGKTWTEPVKIGEPEFWLWRVTWLGKKAYGVGYGCKDLKIARLYASEDGKTFEPTVKTFFEGGYPNESSILFQPDGTALCLLRRDEADATARLGSAKSPYTEWTWKDLKVRLGGPHLLRLPDGRMVAAGRRYDGGQRTSLHWLDSETGTMTEFLKLPSGGDTSYPGLVWHDGLLWVSYYSSHEKKTSIYRAKVKLPAK
jgi:hypothetical protein